VVRRWQPWLGAGSRGQALAAVVKRWQPWSGAGWQQWSGAAKTTA